MFCECTDYHGRDALSVAIAAQQHVVDSLAQSDEVEVLYQMAKFRESDCGDYQVASVILDALREKQKRESPEPMSCERFEEICEAVHNAWWEEKKAQGATEHPDMIPYSELAESVKDYDRVTVRRVLDSLGITYAHNRAEALAE